MIMRIALLIYVLLDAYLLFLFLGGLIFQWGHPFVVIINALLVFTGVLAVRRIFRRGVGNSHMPRRGDRKLRAEQAGMLNSGSTFHATPKPDYKTGIFVAPDTMRELEIKRVVSGWGKNNPNDASLAVALYDRAGGVTVSLFETFGDKNVLWSGGVGEIGPLDASFDADDPSAVDAQVRALVNNALGLS